MIGVAEEKKEHRGVVAVAVSITVTDPEIK